MSLVFNALVVEQMSSSLQVFKPTVTRPGDVLLMFFFIDYAPAFTDPSGWTPLQQHTTNIATRLYWRKADGSEPASWTISWTGGQEANSAEIVLYRGVSTVDDSVQGIGSAGPPYPIPSLTTHSAGERVVLFFLGDTGFGSTRTITAPATFATLDSGNFIGVFDAVVPVAGPAPGGQVNDSDNGLTQAVLDYVALVPE